MSYLFFSLFLVLCLSLSLSFFFLSFFEVCSCDYRGVGWGGVGQVLESIAIATLLENMFCFPLSLVSPSLTL